MKAGLRVTGFDQFFLKLNVHINHMGILLIHRFSFNKSGVGSDFLHLEPVTMLVVMDPHFENNWLSSFKIVVLNILCVLELPGKFGKNSTL